jgi:hypothetical protein
VELELVSTTALQKILQSDDGQTRGERRGNRRLPDCQ